MPIGPETAFICYSREDSQFVRQLALDLKAAGAQVWMDKLDIRPGQDWAMTVESAMKACARMLVILSPNSVASSQVRAEFNYALNKKKEVIPVVYRECEIPYLLQPYQYADFVGDYQGGVGTLLEALGVTRQTAAASAALASPVALATPECSAPASGEKEPTPDRHDSQAEVVRADARPQPLPVQPARITDQRIAKALSRSVLTWIAGGLIAVGLVIWLINRRPQEQASQTQAPAEQQTSQNTTPPQVNQPTTQSLNNPVSPATLPSGLEETMAETYRRALAGDAGAMETVGSAFWSGQGARLDYDQATSWFRKAAEAGNAQGMSDLGFAYATGKGATTDYSQAVKWFRKAAEAGNADGMTNLGYMYENGYGVEKDLQQALALYRKAAKLGNQHAKDQLNRLGQTP